MKLKTVVKIDSQSQCFKTFQDPSYSKRQFCRFDPCLSVRFASENNRTIGIFNLHRFNRLTRSIGSVSHDVTSCHMTPLSGYMRPHHPIFHGSSRTRTLVDLLNQLKPRSPNMSQLNRHPFVRTLSPDFTCQTVNRLGGRWQLWSKVPGHMKKLESSCAKVHECSVQTGSVPDPDPEPPVEMMTWWLDNFLLETWKWKFQSLVTTVTWTWKRRWSIGHKSYTVIHGNTLAKSIT